MVLLYELVAGWFYITYEAFSCKKFQDHVLDLIRQGSNKCKVFMSHFEVTKAVGSLKYFACS